MSIKFDRSILRPEHRALVDGIVGGSREPDQLIAPDGEPYLARWHVIKRSAIANVYLHVQLLSDGDRGPHDHPWDNMSVILAGGYDEEVYFRHVKTNPPKLLGVYQRKPGDTVQRYATGIHRLVMPKWNDLGYTITLFTTGPKIREWGFWIDGEWRHWSSVTEERDGASVLRTQHKRSEIGLLGRRLCGTDAYPKVTTNQKKMRRAMRRAKHTNTQTPCSPPAQIIRVDRMIRPLLCWLGFHKYNDFVEICDEYWVSHCRWCDAKRERFTYQ